MSYHCSLISIVKQTSFDYLFLVMLLFDRLRLVPKEILHGNEIENSVEQMGILNFP